MLTGIRERRGDAAERRSELPAERSIGNLQVGSLEATPRPPVKNYSYLVTSTTRKVLTQYSPVI